MKNRRKGFTLAELLIVVAIIAVLVGVAIPVFRMQLEKTREAHDIYVMRQAASAAAELFYSGINSEKSANAAGLRWWNNEKENENAAGVYDPSTGRFRAEKGSETKLKPYGKGTKLDGGTNFFMGNERGAYASGQDYTNGIVMVSIFTRKRRPYVDVYWKDKDTKINYIGGPTSGDIANYSLRIYLD